MGWGRAGGVCEGRCGGLSSLPCADTTPLLLRRRRDWLALPRALPLPLGLPLVRVLPWAPPRETLRLLVLGLGLRRKGGPPLLPLALPPRLILLLPSQVGLPQGRPKLACLLFSPHSAPT